ncbi:hypothetical protein DY000_02047957 [Brassica cretica]|uniref:Uncharacterized protein n=1 Tax=Brassica cretica TaxID=69181 RepID=A0ABQ7EZ45_BRACR|nr:hypothetical protein DY000_02047957 [Brassica cretica]
MEIPIEDRDRVIPERLRMFPLLEVRFMAGGLVYLSNESRLWVEAASSLSNTRLLIQLRCPFCRARLLRSDRAEHELGRCVATFFELFSDVSCFLRKAFCKEESISKKYLSEKLFSFSSSDVLNVNFVVTVFYPNMQPPASPIDERGTAIPIEDRDRVVPECLRLCGVIVKGLPVSHVALGKDDRIAWFWTLGPPE